MKKTFIYLLLALAVSACKKGSPLDNELPDTRISLDAINLVGENRLRSEVDLSWFGSDADGYVIDYELSFDGNTWDFTESTDSTFNFSLPVGQDTSDITFFVRSIDNAGGVDPTPDLLSIPIKNTPPTATFDSVNVLPDTAYIVTTIFFDVDDLDGLDNLDSLYLKVNNGPWYDLDPDTRIVTLVPTDSRANGSIASNVLEGATASQLSLPLSGLDLNGDNTFYLRARDIAGSESVVDTSKLVFVRNQASDFLVVDAHASGSNPTPEDVLYPALNSAYPAGYDLIDLFTGNGVNQPVLWSPTFALFLEFYDAVFWYAGTGEDELIILESAAGPVQEFLNEGGKMMISHGFPTSPTGIESVNSSVILEFTPMDSISSSNGQARLPNSRPVFPLGNFSASYDTLESSAFIAGASPIYVKPTSESMYQGDIDSTGGWVGPAIFGARSQNSNNNTNMVFFSIELHKLDSIPGSIENVFNQVLNNEFNW